MLVHFCVCSGLTDSGSWYACTCDVACDWCLGIPCMYLYVPFHHGFKLISISMVLHSKILTKGLLDLALQLLHAL